MVHFHLKRFVSSVLFPEQVRSGRKSPNFVLFRLFLPLPQLQVTNKATHVDECVCVRAWMGCVRTWVFALVHACVCERLGGMAWVFIDGCVLCVGVHSCVRECVLFQNGLFVSQQNFHFLGAENKLL